MDLLVPEIVADVCLLSSGLLIAGFCAGLILWIMGWWSHRFWLVMGATVLAGIWGLQSAGDLKANPLATALLLALAGGLLGLALARVLTYTAGGLFGMLLVQAIYPNFQQPVLSFLAFGLVCICLYRIGIIFLTSFLGALLMGYCGMGLMHHQGTLDAVRWSQQNGQLFTWGCGLLCVLGSAVQFLRERGRGRAGSEPKESKPRKKTEESGGLFAGVFRQAG